MITRTSLSLKGLAFVLMLFVMTACSKEDAKPDESPSTSQTPEIASVSPAKGVPGTSVVIQGQHLSEVKDKLRVEVDGTGVDIESVSDTQIKIKAPQHKPGQVNVVVFSGDKKIKSATFSYRFPEMTGISPQKADLGTIIIINGKYFKAYPLDDLIVWFDQEEAEIKSVSDDAIHVVAPEHAIGAAKITLEVMGEKSSSSLDFSYTEPISNDFAEGVSGWTVWGDAQGAEVVPEFGEDGGVQNGYIYAEDDVTGGVWYFQAPDAYSGDRSDAYGKKLSFSLKQSSLTRQFEYPENPDVILEGPNFNVVYNTENHPGTSWTDYEIEISVSDRWTIDRMDGDVATEAQIKEVLADLKGFKIRGEYREGSDTGALDNPYFPGVN